ncbi:unnamed protein product, partial [Bubo scandiacus]
MGPDKIAAGKTTNEISLSCEYECREHSWTPSPSPEQNTRVDLWAGLLGNSNSLLFMMFCRKLMESGLMTFEPLRLAALQIAFS